MKKFNIMMLISFALILVCTVTAFSASADTYKSDNAVGLLTAIKVLDEGYNPEKVTAHTRAEFVGMSVRLMNSTYAVDASLPFKDVAVNDKYYNEIAVAYSKGLISGTDEFRPDDRITLQEATKILVTMIGHNDIANRSGGYPIGYMNEAKLSGIYDGVNINSEFISGNIAVRLLYNTLFTEVYRPEIYSDNDVSYVKDTNIDLLYESFGIRAEVGILNATEHTSLIGAGTGEKSIISIDDKMYNYEGDAEKLLGYRAAYFYKVDESKLGASVVYICAPTAYNSEIAIDDYNIIPVSRTEVKYENKSGKVITHKIDSYADFIYNGAAYTEWDFDDVSTSNGNIRLVDNDNDGDTDVIFVNEYVDYAVEQYVKNANTIALQFNMPAIDLEDDNYISRILYNDTVIEAADLRNWDILSVAESHPLNGKSLRTINVSRKSFSGQISQKGKDTVSVNDVEYRYVEYPKQFKATLSLNGKFFCNILDKIVAYDGLDQYMYGYVRGKDKTDDVFSPQVKIMLMNRSGNREIYTINKKARIDGESIGSLSPDEILAKIKVDEVVRYRLNANMEVSYIDIAFDIDNGEPPANKENENNSLSKDKKRMKQNDDDKGDQFRTDSYELADTALILSSTEVFFVPEDSSSETDYYVGTCEDILQAKYFYDAYDLDETMIAGAVVIKTQSGQRKPADSSNMAIVTSVGRTLNSNGEIAVALNIYQSGLEIEDFWISVDDTALYSSLEIGDVIQYKESINDVGRIVSLRTLISAEKLKNEIFEVAESVGSNSSQLSTVYGTVKAVSQNAIVLNSVKNGRDVSLPGYLKNGVVFYIYDAKSNTVELGSVLDILVGDNVFVRENYTAIQEGVIVRN